MRLLSRHVSTTVLFSIFIVLVVMVSLNAMAAIVEGVDDIKGAFTFSALLVHVGITLPTSIYENIPFSALIGCLVGLGLLASNSELVVMRAAGVSVIRIVSFVLKPTVALIIIGTLIGEYVVPYTEQFAEGRKALLQGRQEQMANASGLWNKENNEFIHVAVILPSGELFGVNRFRFSEEGEIEEVSFAALANFRGDHWLEQDVLLTRFEEQGTVVDAMDRRRWESTLSPDLLRLVMLEPDSLAISELYDYANYLETQGQSASRHWLAFWSKALQPLVTASLVLIAVSFVFGPLRDSNMGFRIFAGVVTGIMFSTSQRLLGPASIVFEFSPLWSVLGPVGLCVIIGVLLLRRAA
jgi:lipopolysaccharide export system permease protein